jgi:hypothetical protein
MKLENNSREATFLENIDKIKENDYKEVECVNEFYKDKYHHKYREIMEYVINNYNVELGYKIEILSCLVNKLDKDIYLREKLKDPDRYIYNIKKLIDYLELEEFRHKIVEEKYEDILKTIEEKSKNIQESLEVTDSSLVITKSKIDKMEFGIVGTLGIFIGIVRTFAGTFTIIGYALMSRDKFNIFETVFITALLGLVLSNVLYILINGIARLIGREHVFNKCRHYPNIEYCNECKNKCGLLKKSYNRKASIAIYNFLWIMLLICIVYLYYSC